MAHSSNYRTIVVIGLDPRSQCKELGYYTLRTYFLAFKGSSLPEVLKGSDAVVLFLDLPGQGYADPIDGFDDGSMVGPLTAVNLHQLWF